MGIRRVDHRLGLAVRRAEGPDHRRSRGDHLVGHRRRGDPDPGVGHAELGAMYPVAGGSARFPHYAFGGAAGASFGWFSWLQAATVAPIEVSAVINYATHYSFASGWLTTNSSNPTLTTSGLIVAVVLMAIISSINFLGVRALALTNSAATWWKVEIGRAHV